MSAHIELHLLSKLIHTGDMKTVLEAGINSDIFGQLEARALFKNLLKYYKSPDSRGVVPDLNLLPHVHGTIDLPSPHETERYTLKSLCKEVKRVWLIKQIEEAIVKAEDDYTIDPDKTLSELMTTCKDLQSVVNRSHDIKLADSLDEVRDEYIQARDSKELKGIPYPMGWGYHDARGRPLMVKRTGRQNHPLNEQTRGKCDGEFILFYGRPKSMKTWLLIDMAVEDYFYSHKRVLIFSKEMTPAQIRTRLVARMLSVDYTALRNGLLTEIEEAELDDLVEELKGEEERFTKKGLPSSLLITTGWQGTNLDTDSLLSLQSKIDEFDPDVVYADAIYLMESGQKNTQVWAEIKKLAYGLKSIAIERGIPIIGTSQANRRGEETKGSTLSEIAYGDAFGQACDLAIRVIKRELTAGVFELACIISGGREINLPGFLLEIELAKKIRLKQIFESQRQIQAIFKAEEEALALEEEEEKKKIVQAHRLDLAKLRQRAPGFGGG